MGKRWTVENRLSHLTSSLCSHFPLASKEHNVERPTYLGLKDTGQDQKEIRWQARKKKITPQQASSWSLTIPPTLGTLATSAFFQLLLLISASGPLHVLPWFTTFFPPFFWPGSTVLMLQLLPQHHKKPSMLSHPPHQVYSGGSMPFIHSTKHNCNSSL